MSKFISNEILLEISDIAKLMMENTPVVEKVLPSINNSCRRIPFSQEDKIHESR